MEFIVLGRDIDVTWVIQTNLIDINQTTIVAANVLASGGKVVGVNVIPFQDHVDLHDPVETSNVVPYGSTKLTKLAHQHNWNGLFFNDNFSVVEWNAHRPDMLNKDCMVCEVKDVPKRLYAIPNDENLFIRPIHDLKEFAGTVTTVKEIKNWMRSTESGNFSFTEDTLVSIAPVQQIRAEWRWFIVNGQIIDGSVYRMFGERKLVHETNLRVISGAQYMADIWLPHKTCVMDLALMADNTMKVIEFNCFNSSGMYDNDICHIVSAVNNSFQH